METAQHAHGAVHSFLKIAAATLVLTGIASAASARAQYGSQDEADIAGVRIQIDNDLFAGDGERDRDYTGGMALMLSGREAADGFLSLDPLLARLDDLSTGSRPNAEVRHARQLGLMAFTPRDIVAREPLHDDRPYASLLFISNGRVRIDESGRDAWSSSLTVGVLGLSLAERLHSTVHKAVGSELPRGYGNQISTGGEPTARYTLARHHLWIANPAGTLDVKTTLQGSVGYLTETSASISLRAGRFASSWWSFTPELTDYIAAPTPVDVQQHSHPEFYFFTGLRVKARAYNAFLQGQFRDSAVHYSFDEIEPIVAEAWMGFATQLWDQTQVSYTLNYQTAEIRRGAAARSALWGGVQLSHSF
jgi:hypothetical protein